MDYNLCGVGIYDRAYQQVDPTHRAARVSLRPPEVGVYGSHRKTLKSGVISAGLSGPLPVWEMRWGQSSVIAVVRKLKIQAIVSTTAMSATAVDSSFSLYRAQGFTTMDGTNGTFASFANAKSNVIATRMAISQLAGDTSTSGTGNGRIVILNTSASGLTGGTKTLDSDPMAIVLNRIVNTASSEAIITPESPDSILIDPAEAAVIPPVELNINEGLVLQCDAITGTGTWRIKVEVCWDEVDPARYF